VPATKKMYATECAFLDGSGVFQGGPRWHTRSGLRDEHGGPRPLSKNLSLGHVPLESEPALSIDWARMGRFGGGQRAKRPLAVA
jgi:hypothetical protein